MTFSMRTADGGLHFLCLCFMRSPGLKRDEGKGGGHAAGQACGGHSGCKLRVASCYLLVGWQQKQLPFCCVWHATVRQVVVVAPADAAVTAAAGGKLK